MKIRDTRQFARLVHVTTASQALIFLNGQVGYMRARGFDVLAISSPGADAERFRAQNGVPVHFIDMPRRITPLRDLVALSKMYRYFRRVRPEIVHAHTPKGGLLGTIAAWLARVPVRIYHVRGLPFMTATGRRRILLRSTERLSCALAHHVLCVSASIRDTAVHEGLCAAEKIAVLRNGSGNGVDAAGRFDPARWTHARACTRSAHGIPPTALVLGFVGRIVRDKGITELTESWTRLRDDFPNLHLLLVGTVEDGDPLPESVHDLLRRDARVHLAGTQEDTAPFYAAMDVVVLPTYREGFPNVPLEAAAMRLPVVATAIPGCIDAVRDGITGTLVPPRDAAALCEALSAYLRDEELRARHGRAGRAWVLETFQPADIWRAVHGEYLRLLQKAHLVRAGSVETVDDAARTTNAVDLGGIS